MKGLSHTGKTFHGPFPLFRQAFPPFHVSFPAFLETRKAGNASEREITSRSPSFTSGEREGTSHSPPFTQRSLQGMRRKARERHAKSGERPAKGRERDVLHFPHHCLPIDIDGFSFDNRTRIVGRGANAPVGPADPLAGMGSLTDDSPFLPPEHAGAPAGGFVLGSQEASWTESGGRHALRQESPTTQITSRVLSSSYRVHFRGLLGCRTLEVPVSYGHCASAYIFGSGCITDGQRFECSQHWRAA